VSATENQWRWRTGRKVGRTVYVQWGNEPSDADTLIGMMDSVEIAEEAVSAHNERLGESGNREARSSMVGSLPPFHGSAALPPAHPEPSEP
jgi:hypothetical protein